MHRGGVQEEGSGNQSHILFLLNVEKDLLFQLEYKHELELAHRRTNQTLNPCERFLVGENWSSM